MAWLGNNRCGDTPRRVYSPLSFSLVLGEGFLWILGDVGSILTPGHLESTARSRELFSKDQAFPHDRSLCTPGLCITQGRQGILMPGRRETCGAYISLSRVSSSLGVSPHIIPLHFSLSVSRSLRLFLSLSLSLSISLLGPCGSHFLLLLGSLPTQLYGLNFFSSLATYVYMNGTLDFVHSGLDSVICRLVVGVEVVITACAEVRPDGHLPG